MIIAPIRLISAVSVFVWSRGKKRLTPQTLTELARTIIMLVSTVILCRITNSSAIYHWIRGQGNFKLYLLKALFCVSDVLMRWTCLTSNETLSQEFTKPGRYETKAKVIFFHTFQVTIHSLALVMEMFVVHVALTMSTDSCFVYVLIDCFNELKLSVFKKLEYKQLYSITCDDSVERF